MAEMMADGGVYGEFRGEFEGRDYASLLSYLRMEALILALVQMASIVIMAKFISLIR